MSIAAKLYVEAQVGRRSSRRDLPAAESTLRTEDAGPLDIAVSDISLHGFRAQCVTPPEIGSEVRLGLSGAGSTPALVVWRMADEFGCEFIEPLSRERLDSAFSGTPIHRLEREYIGPPSKLLGAIDACDEPVVEKWPLLVRVAFILGSSLALWALIITGIITAWPG